MPSRVNWLLPWARSCARRPTASRDSTARPAPTPTSWSSTSCTTRTPSTCSRCHPWATSPPRSRSCASRTRARTAARSSCRPRPSPPPRPSAAALVQPTLHHPPSIYVLEMPPLGDIPAPIQELRKSYPRSHSRLVKLPPLTWNEVSSGPLQGVPFELAARAYLTAQGNPSYLRELQERELPLTPGARLPVPQHLQQLVQFYLTLLTPHARNSLERLAVHPGPIPDGLLLGFSVKPVLTEL